MLLHYGSLVIFRGDMPAFLRGTSGTLPASPRRTAILALAGTLAHVGEAKRVSQLVQGWEG
eukprot:8420369-Alexandrium_andersonii.AAC.1